MKTNFCALINVYTTVCLCDYIPLNKAFFCFDIKSDILANGPLNTGMMVYQDFFDYKSGIYVHHDEFPFPVGGHTVVILGWGTEDLNYWICQNSWGPNWGEDGYFRIAFGESFVDVLACSGEPAV